MVLSVDSIYDDQERIIAHNVNTILAGKHDPDLDGFWAVLGVESTTGISAVNGFIDSKGRIRGFFSNIGTLEGDDALFRFLIKVRIDFKAFQIFLAGFSWDSFGLEIPSLEKPYFEEILTRTIAIVNEKLNEQSALKRINFPKIFDRKW